MNDVREIVIDEVFPHNPEIIWKALTTAELIGRWLLVPNGFEPSRGKHFTFQTTAAGEWDGIIHCEVLEVTPNERLAFTWRGGHEGNGQYGSHLETIVTWTLTKVDGGTRLRLVHSGFLMPKNEFAFKRMSDGWPRIFHRINAISSEVKEANGETANP